MSEKLSDDFKAYPYWWEGTSQQQETEPAPLPAKADVVIVGAGLTGTTAAHTLALAGRDVLILDAGRPGSGASSRNGGMLGRYFKHSFGQMKDSAGLDTAIAYFRELCTVYDFAVDRIRDHGLDAGFRDCGRVVGAVTQAHKERLFREWELRARHIGEAVEFLDGDSPELSTSRYVAGIRIVENSSVHPGLYADATIDLARRAGARIIGETPVLGLERTGNGFRVATARGTVETRDVVVATNGYTSPKLGWFHKRLSPIEAFMVATEPLSDGAITRIRDLRSTYHDNRKNSNYYQISEDGRLVFGGRTGLHHSSVRQMAMKLHEEMLYFFPELEGTRITHAWNGRCAATEDLFPHVGTHNGVHFAIGYCFSGNAMAPYLGHKAAMRLLGDRDGAHTLFTQDALRLVPWPKRQTWLIPIAMQYFRWKEPLPR